MQTKPVRPRPSPCQSPPPLSLIQTFIGTPVIRRLRQVWDHHTPSEYRHDNKHKLHKDFTFHANVSDGTKYPGWAEESRRALLQSMMAMPAEFEIPIIFAAVKRGAFD
jgi:hypothetical protein